MEEKIITVDENDVEQGSIEKIEAHLKGVLHRAFSIFIFNSNGELLLQRRAMDKYHSSGLWSNTCCSHPRYGERLEEAVHRRIIEEMGIDCELKEIFSFIYKAQLEDGLTEYEYDHVFAGKFDDEVIPNKSEVEDYDWVSIEQLREDIKIRPENYTFWFKECLERVMSFIEGQYKEDAQ